MVYDLHAYTKSNLPDDFFNYSYSVPGAATVDDKDWNINLFHPKQNYLVAGENYERITYPGFLESPTGELILKYRFGSPNNANMRLNTYDGNRWSEQKAWNNANDIKYGVYGGFKIVENKMYMIFARRTIADRKEGYTVNRGIYFAYSNNPDDGFGDWFNMEGEKLSLPVSNITNLEIFDPAKPGDDYHAPCFATADNGAMHFLAPLRRKNTVTSVHYYKRPNDVHFSTSELSLQDVNYERIEGNLFAAGNTIFLVFMVKDSLTIYSASAGTSSFQLQYQAPEEPKYRKGVTTTWKDSNGSWHLFVAMMSVSEGEEDKQPLHILHFLLPEKV